MRKLKKNELCPCDSGKKYKHCCFNKDFDFLENLDKEIFKSQKISEPIVLNIISRQEKEFKKIFGREPLKSDPLFVESLLLSEDDYKEKVSALLASINVKPQIIYAFKKLGYCVMEGQQNKYTDKELLDWEDSVKEYFLMKKNKNEAPDFTKKMQRVELSFTKTKLIYALLIHKYNNDLKNNKADSKDFVKSYCYFILSKNLKSIKSIEILIQNNLGEDAINLIRSIYENYLQIMLALYCPNQLQDELEAKIGLLSKEYERKKGNFNTLTHSETKKEIKILTGIKRAALNPCTKNEDLEIYSYLYDFLSSFTHPDIRSIEQYFSEDGFSHLQRNLEIESKLYLCVINILLMSELTDSKFIDEVSISDLKNFINEINPVLQDIFIEIVNDNPEYPIVFVKRLQKINTHL